MPQTLNGTNPEMDRESLAELAAESVALTEKAVLAATQLVRELTQGEYCVLVYLESRTDDTSAVEIADQVSLTRPRITQIVSDLEKRGYVTRAKDDLDKRKVRIRITDEGRAVVNKQREVGIESQMEFLHALGDDAETFVRILGKALDYFEEKYGVKL